MHAAYFEYILFSFLMCTHLHTQNQLGISTLYGTGTQHLSLDCQKVKNIVFGEMTVNVDPLK